MRPRWLKASLLDRVKGPTRRHFPALYRRLPWPIHSTQRRWHPQSSPGAHPHPSQGSPFPPPAKPKCVLLAHRRFLESAGGCLDSAIRCGV